MKERLQRFYNNITRLVTNEVISYKIHLIWLIITLVLFGFFGVYPLSKSMVANYKLVREMTKTNVMLRKKITDIADAKDKMDDISDFLKLLEIYLPDNFNIQNYIVDFVFSAGDADYVIDRFTPVKQDKGSVDIAVNLIGTGDPLKLIKNIESLIRVTEIQEVRFSKGVDFNELTLTVKTFIMEKQ